MRSFKPQCSPYAVELIIKEKTHSANYMVQVFGLPGVLPNEPDLDQDCVTLTQGDNVDKLQENCFDMNTFCNTLDSSDDLNDSVPFRRANLTEFIRHHNMGHDYRVLTFKHWKYDVVHYIVLYGKVAILQLLLYMRRFNHRRNSMSAFLGCS
jgi:hypothetical protein